MTTPEPPKRIGWDDVTDEDFITALLDCQEQLKQARDEAAELRVEVERLRQDREPDHLYNQDNWEYTCPWAERGDILSDEIEGADGVVHYRTLYEGAYVFAANVPIEFDDDGCPVRFEIQWFDSQAAAEAALCALVATEGQP